MYDWSTLTLKKKILFGFFIVIVIMFIITLWGTYNFYRINLSLKQTIAEKHAGIVAADNMGKAIDKQIMAIGWIYSSDTVNGEILFTEAINDFTYWYNRARKTAFTDRERILLDSLNMNYQEFVETLYLTKYIDKFGRIDLLGKSEGGYQFLTSIHALKSQCYGIYNINNDILKGIIRDSDNITNSTIMFLYVFLLSGIIFSLVFSIKFSNYLINPLRKLIDNIKHISDGNFGDRLEVKSLDELGTLAMEFNVMSEKLEKYEKMNLEKMLYEKRKSETIIESLNEPVVITDENLNIFKANTEFINQFSLDGVENKSINLLFKKNIIFEKILNCTLKETDDSFDNIIVYESNGSTKYYKLIHSLVSIPDSKLLGYVFVFHDITKFQELDRMKSEFVGKVSHELKTPLTSMGMALGILEDGIVGKLSDKQGSIVESIKEDYDRLNKLVHEILELTRLEAGNFSLQISKVEIKELFDKLLKSFHFQADEKKIDLTYNIEPETVYINADYDYLLKAFENIIANSIKFTQTGGKILLNAYHDDNFNYITITDTGIGIYPENIDKIFDKFVQFKDDIPGSIGLGLSITKEIIEMHKGEISVISEPGQGCNFIIKLVRGKNA
ncbi:MAG: ATP-binding protein [bacterium]